MTSSARQREILHQLFADGYVEARALADQFEVDASTIRRDLDTLARAGHVQRTHGGARPMPGAVIELPYALKRDKQLAEKAAIARAGADRVRDGDTVILDSGSTTYAVAQALRHREGLTVITNDLRICKFVATIPRMRLLVTGGELLESVFTLIGEHALSFFADYTADVTFLGADAVDPRAGITNTNTLEVPIKRAMIAAGQSTVVVADSTKFGRRTLAKIAAIAEVDEILTDAGLAGDAAAAYGPRLTRCPLDG